MLLVENGVSGALLKQVNIPTLLNRYSNIVYIGTKSRLETKCILVTSTYTVSYGNLVTFLGTCTI